PVAAEDAELRRRQRNQHLVVRVSESAGGPLTREYAEYLEQESTNSNVLTDESRRRNAEIVSHRGAENCHASAGAIVALGEHLSCRQRVLTHLEIIGRRAEHRGIGVRVQVLNL